MAMLAEAGMDAVRAARGRHRGSISLPLEHGRALLRKHICQLFAQSSACASHEDRSVRKALILACHFSLPLNRPALRRPYAAGVRPRIEIGIHLSGQRIKLVRPTST